MSNETTKPMVGFGEYLAEYNKQGQIDFHLRINSVDGELVEFYIRPQGISGDTRDYCVGIKGKAATHVENLELIKRLLIVLGKEE